MCIGLPMQVMSLDAAGAALCRAREASAATRRVNLSLLDQAPEPGQWVLVHVDVALHPLSEQEARQVADALQAVGAAARGQPFEHLLGDLLTQEPQLPEHLRGPSADNAHLQAAGESTRGGQQHSTRGADGQPSHHGMRYGERYEKQS